MSAITLVKSEQVISYPEGKDYFSPSVSYPEYLWKDVTSAARNDVYDLFRKCLIDAELDKEHIGTEKWNPLGAYIKAGDTVLIKPNWVEDKNSNKSVQDKLNCLVTNPSLIRAITDYVIIALGDTGRIIIGDAPMQGCDLDNMFRIKEYDRLFEFYHSKGVRLEVCDLRKYHVLSVTHGTVSKPILTESKTGSIAVDISSESMHCEKDFKNPVYKVSDYLTSDTKKYHSQGKHIYEVNRLALEADVIINVPKPKTHRLAGMTAACKNFVGITYEKASLPHRVLGGKKDGGDSYLKSNSFKNLMQKFDEKRTEYSIKEKYRLAKIMDLGMKAAYVIGSSISGDKYRIGSWYGNDTIWRTTVDLNYILRFADKSGKVQDDVQRTIITIGDMIVCGQKSGPVGPDPKYLGMIMMSDDVLLFDWVMCEIMGFDRKKLPMLNSKGAFRKLGVASPKESNAKMITVNGARCHVSDFHSDKEWHFDPHPNWKGHIEQRNQEVE